VELFGKIKIKVGVR